MAKDIVEFTYGSKSIKELFKTILYKIRFARNNPDYFYPFGIWVFTGEQSAGKTISAVKCLKAILKEYPKALVCSNMEIKGLDREVIPFKDYSQLSELSNGIEGVIFLIDEIHVLWNSLESKEIPISEMACFCQMRKDRRVIIGTSQVYGRVAKPIREQLRYIIDCKNLFNLIQINTILDPADAIEKDGHVGCKKIKTQIWVHSVDDYDSYDTLFKIEKASRSNNKGVKKYGSNRY